MCSIYVCCQLFFVVGGATVGFWITDWDREFYYTFCLRFGFGGSTMELKQTSQMERDGGSAYVYWETTPGLPSSHSRLIELPPASGRFFVDRNKLLRYNSPYYQLNLHHLECRLSPSVVSVLKQSVIGLHQKVKRRRVNQRSVSWIVTKLQFSLTQV